MQWYPIIVAFATWVATVPLVVADFQLYAYYDREILLAGWDLTSSCIDALYVQNESFIYTTPKSCQGGPLR